MFDWDGKAAEVFKQAEGAFYSWNQSSLQDRIRLLKNLRLLIAAKRQQIAESISESVRKTEAEALSLEVFPTILFIRWLEKNLRKVVKGQRIAVPLEFAQTKAWTEYRASGVALIIAPWNFPFYLSLVPALSAIAGGNTAVVKPSEYAEGMGELLLDLFEKAGFPDGVLRYANGAADMVQALIKQDFSRIFFTGSTKVGKIIATAAAQRLIPCATELGGISAMIVFADADLERAVNGALFSAFAGCGQICVASKRLYVQAEIYDDFVAKLAKKVENLSQGDLKNNDLGYIRLPKHYLYLQELIDDALAKGAEKVCGFINEDKFSPVILKNVNHNMRIMQEEAFGPVLPVMSFDGSIKQAVELADDTNTGLSASVWTSNKNKGLDVMKKLKSGLLSLNEAVSGVAIPALPFGGVKQSGTGRTHGVEGVRFFMDEISYTAHKGKNKKEIFWFGYGKKYLSDLTDAMGFYAKKRNFIKIIKALLRLWQRRKDQ